MGKRRKNYYAGAVNEKRKKYNKLGGKLDAGVCGIVITHDRGKEASCRNDAFRLFNYFANVWYGPHVYITQASDSEKRFQDFSKEKETSEGTTFTEVNQHNAGDAENSDEESFDLALSNEVKLIKKESSSKNMEKQRFSALKSGCNNVVFIKCLGLSPSEFVQSMIKEICTNRKDIPLAKAVLRMHPADVTCKARILEIKQQAESYLPKALNQLVNRYDGSISFKNEFNILYRGRNNEHLHMHDVVDAISSAAEDAGTGWRYNCRCDAVHVVVDVIKTVCSIGLVHSYIKYKKFNVRELFVMNKVSSLPKNNKNADVEDPIAQRPTSATNVSEVEQTICAKGDDTTSLNTHESKDL